MVLHSSIHSIDSTARRIGSGLLFADSTFRRWTSLESAFTIDGRGMQAVLVVDAFVPSELRQSRTDGTLKKITFFFFFFFINSLFLFLAQCVSHSWYLAVDMQLYALAPLLIYPLWRWKLKCLPVVPILIVASMSTTFALFIVYQFSIRTKQTL